MTHTTPTEDRQSPKPLGAATDNAALAFNWQEHRDLLADCGMTQTQEHEFLETLWAIAVSYVDLTLGLHPAQLATGNHDVDDIMIALVEHWADAAQLKEEA